MMKIRAAAFSSRGVETARKIADAIGGVSIFAPEKFLSDGVSPMECGLAEWTRRSFAEADALIFVSATGIAVRSIAPHVKSKASDPAIVVVDELGLHAISLLSGHLGGANELTLEIARAIGADPVITTATDVNGYFSVDDFARRNRLRVTDLAAAKEVSAAVLAGEKIGVVSSLDLPNELPKEILTSWVDAPRCGFIVGKNIISPFETALALVPMDAVVGVGCRRGKSADDLHRFALDVLESTCQCADEVACVASIDVKADEPGLIELAERFGAEFKTFSADELSSIEGNFSSSNFVRETVGVDCVCERSAVAAGGDLVVGKTSRDGMTIALAKLNRTEALDFGQTLRSRYRAGRPSPHDDRG